MALPADTVVVSEVRPRPGGNWECLIDLPDGTSHRLVVPAALVSVAGVQFSAGVIAKLYAAQKANGG